MRDQDKTREQLISENEELQRRVARLEGVGLEAGKPVNTVGMIKDITERKRAEEALQKAHDELEQRVEERTAELAKANEELAIFRKFAEASGQGFSMADLDGHLLYLNPALCRMLDVEKPEDYIGQHLSICYSEESNRRGKHEIEPVLMREGYWEGELPMLSCQGKSIPTWHNGFVIRDERENPLRLAVVITDMTERKATEEALPASEERFRAIFEEAPVGMAIGLGNGVIGRANRALCHMGGYTQEELVGRCVRDLTHPDDRELSGPFLKRLFAGEIPSFTIEKRYLRKDGQPVWTRTTEAAVHGPDGKVAFALGIVEDITARKQAEEATRQLLKAVDEERGRLQAIIDSLPVGLWIADAAGRMTLINDSARTIWGGTAPYAEKTEDYGMYKAWWADSGKLIVADDMPMTRSLRGETCKEKVIDFERFDGTIGTQLVSSTPIKTADGTVIGSVAVVQDITERKRAEEALRQSHAQLQTIYDGIVEGLLITDIETKQIRRVNSSFCRMLGYGEEELLTKSIPDLHPPEEVVNDLQRFQEAAEGQVSINEDRPVLRKDGSVFYADITGHRILYEGWPCLFALFRDISERKQAQAALRQSHGELHAIYDGMTDGLLIADIDTKQFIRANPAICRMLGYSEAELLSMSVRDIHPTAAVQATFAIFQAQSEGRIHVNENSPVLRKDGSVFYADIASNTLSYAGRTCMVGIFRDITERRRAHEALLRERRTLKHMLKANDHERRLIAYDIHDGLAQELVGAMMQFQIYAHAKETKPKDASKAFDAAMTLLRQSHAEARRLISGVRPPILDESGVVAAIAHLVYDPAFDQGPKIDLRSRVTFSRLAPVLENVIYRIAQEGLSNARNHSKSKKILVSLIQRGERLRIEIRDWGVGFDPQTVKENHFGLEGIRERARLLGGKCNIKSKPGEGTAVIVELPVAERESEQ